MKILLILFLLCSTANAALTPNRLPKTKTGGSSPTLQDSIITDTGTNVGVGSTAPTTTLDVNGTVKATAFQSQASTAGSVQLYEAAANGTNSVTYSAPSNITSDVSFTLPAVDGSSGQAIVTDGSGTLSFGSVAGYWTLGSDNVSINTTYNIGLGSVNPTQKLDIVGNIKSTNYYVDGYGTSPQISNAIDTNTGMFFSGPDIIDFHTGGSHGLVINSAQNVGIGTSSATTRLNIGAGSTGLNDEFVNINSGSGSGAEPQIRFSRNSVLKSAIYVKDPTETLYFYTATAGDNFAMTQAGNVGVSTVVPTARFHVLQANAVDAFRVDDIAGDTTPFVINSTGNVGIGTFLPTSRFVIDNNYVQFDSNGKMKLARNTSTSAAIGQIDFSNSNGFSSGSTVYGIIGEVSNSSTGNVIGYNTTSASSATGTVNELRGVSSGLRTIAAGTSVTSGFDFYAATPTITAGTITTQYGLYIADQEPNGVTTGYGVYQVTSDNDNYFAGNVGIGTSIPTSLLHIASTASQDLFKVSDSGTGDTTPFIIDSNGNVGIGTQTAGFNLIVNGTAQIGTGSGNVGIGSATPAAKLDVNGGIRLAGNLGGGTTGNVGIGTYGASAATCDSVCNTTNTRRCFIGMTSGGIPTACSVSITGTCLCLPQS